jgi:hypothetical protein
MDSDGAQSTTGFDYDRDGHVIPPAGSLPWDIATFFGDDDTAYGYAAINGQSASAARTAEIEDI